MTTCGSGDRELASHADLHLPCAFLYADPAGHSLSPVMHRAAFDWAGLPGQYVARTVKPADLPAAIAQLRAAHVLGANLSLPHKETVLPFMDALTSAAEAIGAVNTVIREGDQLIGDNTDAAGFLDALDHHGIRPGGQAVVLGAGGAARAAAYALRGAGVPVTVVNRTPHRAEALVQQLGGKTATLSSAEWERTDLVVNATSCGLNDPAASPLDTAILRRLPRTAAVYDMIYRPAVTRLVREARSLGLRGETGLVMLAAQARRSFKCWTGHDVPVGIFLQAAQQQLSGEQGPS